MRSWAALFAGKRAPTGEVPGPVRQALPPRRLHNCVSQAWAGVLTAYLVWAGTLSTYLGWAVALTTCLV